MNERVINSLGMRRFLTFAFIAMVVVMGCNARTNGSKTDMATDSVNRAVAVVMANSLTPIISNLAAEGLPVSHEQVGKYIAEILAGQNLSMTPIEANEYIEKYMIARQKSVPDTLDRASQRSFIKTASERPGAISTPSGLVFEVLVEGEGVYPVATDKIDVSYVAKLSDGTVFDDTGDEQVIFDLSSVIPGFAEGAQMMKPGGTYRMTIPAELAYGSEGIPGIIPGNAALEFTVRLNAIQQ